MAVYVDVFAARLGLRRAWFQEGTAPWLNHYDVTDKVRERALALGAIPEDAHAFVARLERDPRFAERAKATDA